MTTTSATTSSTTGTTSTTTSATASAQATLNQNYSTFLTLLTTQLQNQDPLSPVSSTQFTNQLVLFSQVEQQIDTNSTLSQILAGQNANGGQALGYLGLDVTANGNTFDTTSDGQSTTLGYTLPTASASTTIGIYNSSGVEVYSTTGDTTAGAHTVTWNGEDNSGDAEPAGTYTIAVTAVDANGNTVSPTTQIPGQVTGVTTSGGQTYLTVAGQPVPLSDIITASVPPSSS
jgi:flagellar basal-body rod modification protein FlgD